jgi:hypothetical protein
MPARSVSRMVRLHDDHPPEHVAQWLERQGIEL